MICIVSLGPPKGYVDPCQRFRSLVLASHSGCCFLMSFALRFSFIWGLSVHGKFYVGKLKISLRIHGFLRSDVTITRLLVAPHFTSPGCACAKEFLQGEPRLHRRTRQLHLRRNLLDFLLLCSSKLLHL